MLNKQDLEVIVSFLEFNTQTEDSSEGAQLEDIITKIHGLIDALETQQINSKPYTLKELIDLCGIHDDYARFDWCTEQEDLGLMIRDEEGLFCPAPKVI